MPHNENSRVKIPALVHFTRLGYEYISLKKYANTNLIDEDTNIFLDVFCRAINDIIIKDDSMLNAVIERLAEIGYIHEGDLGIKGREAFKYTDKPHLMKHHLYVCTENSDELRRHIVFRDFLRNNPDAAKRYSAIKEMAAKLYPNDIDKYIEYKSPCIQELYVQCGLTTR